MSAGFGSGSSSQGFLEQTPASLQSLSSTLLSGAQSDALGLGSMLTGGGKTTEAGGGIGLGSAFSQLGASPLLSASDPAAPKSAYGGGGSSSLFVGAESQLVPPTFPDVASTLTGPGAELGEARTMSSGLSLSSGLSAWGARTDTQESAGLPPSLDSSKPINSTLTSSASDTNPHASAIGPDPLAPSLRASESSSGLGGSTTSTGDAATGGSTLAGGGASAARQQLGGGAPPEIIEKALQEFPPSFSKETEDEANSYFQRLYNMQSNGSAPGTQVLSVDDMLDLLRQFKNSNTQKQVISRFVLY